MTNNSTEPQPSATTQNSSDAAAKIVESLTKAIGDLDPWARFGAFFLVVVLIATVVAMLSIDSNEYKLHLIFVFFAVFSLFVLVLYAFSARQTKVENNLLSQKKANNDLQKAADELQAETNKRINGLESIRSQLQEIEDQFRRLPPSNQTELLKRRILDLLKNVSEDLEAIGSYSRKLAVADEFENKMNNSDVIKQIAAKYSGSPAKQAEDR